MVAADFNFANCGAVTAIPAFLSSLNATYSCASVRNVLQGSSLVQLAANQFGTSLDTSTGLYGARIEGAATNLALYSEGDVSNWGAVGVTNAASTFFGATNAFYFVNNAIADRSIKQALSITSGTTYTISAYMIMDDLSTPVVGTSVSTGDFCIVGDATVITSPALVESCGGNVYRVSASITAGSTGSRLFGFYKESTHSAKGFRLTKIQVETGNIATSYIATTSATVTRALNKLTVPLWKNNLKYSTDPTSTGWSRANVTLTGGQSDSAGGTTAWKVEATTTAATSLLQNTIVAPAGVVTYSIKVKAGSGSTTLSFILRNSTTATNFTQGIFTTATGAVSGAGWTSVADGNGYYKLTFTQSSGISVGDTLNCYVGYAGNSITAGYNFYFDSPQLESGSTATTYIPTVNNLEYQKNYLVNSTFLGGGSAPIGWTWTIGTGTSTPVASTTNVAAVAYSQSATAQRPFIGQSLTLSANSTYTFSLTVESKSAGLTAVEAIGASQAISGATTSWPVCEANPSGGSGGVLTTGRLSFTVTTVATSGSCEFRAGLGATGNNTGSIQFSQPQVEVAAAFTSYEPTGSFASTPNANIPGFSSAGYTLFADFRRYVLPNAKRALISLYGNAGADLAYISHSPSVVTTDNIVSSSQQVQTTIATTTLARAKFASSYQVNNCTLALNGVAGSADTATTMPAPIYMELGSVSGGGQAGACYLYALQLITRPITQAQLNGRTQ
jgi:hypothetical protein